MQQASARRLIAEGRDLALHYVMRALPTVACSALGAWLGVRLGQRGHVLANDRAAALLMKLHPDWAATPAEMGANLRHLWQNVGRTYAEFAAIQRILREGRHFVYGEEHLAAAYSEDRPLILCFVHLGNWELLGHYVTSHKLIAPGRPLSGLVMSPTNRAHAFIMKRQRALLPIHLMAMGPHVWHRIADTLRRPGGIVWLAGDEAVDGLVRVPLFGRQPRIDGNLGTIVRLAAATGARVIPMYNERVRHTRFRSHILPVLDMPRGRLTDEAILAQVLRINGIFEPIIRRLMAQWYMAIECGNDPEDPVLG
jgi:KDO2-lipid IV(A) lauroyltransferase